MASRYSNSTAFLQQRYSFVYQEPKPKNWLSKALDRATDFMVEYWAHLVTIMLGTVVACAIAVPFLSYLGLDSISKHIFFSLHLICAQIPAHSFYILGHQLGMCARNFSIYASMFVMSLVFVLSKKRLPGIPWWLWILLMLPIALDGFTQMFGLRESNWILRTLTGTLFGMGTIWFALPMMQKSMDETPAIPPALLQRYQQQAAYATSMMGTTPVAMPTLPTTPATVTQPQPTSAPLQAPVPVEIFSVQAIEAEQMDKIKEE